MTTAPKPFAFVLMPFSEAFTDTYEVAIRPACEAAGSYAERVDEQIFSGSIMDRVYNQISKADIVVADMSERNPNVFYEVGYAHALAKTTILVTKTESDIPFDLRQYPHVVYGNSLSLLKSELERRVRWHIENPKKVETTEQELDIRINGARVVDGSEVLVRSRGEMKYVLLDIAFQNRSDRNIRTISFRAGLSAPDVVSRATDRREYEYAAIAVDGRSIFMYPGPIGLLPKEWASAEFLLRKRHDFFLEGEEFECAVQMYFESGSISLPFRVRVERTQSPVQQTDA